MARLLSSGMIAEITAKNIRPFFLLEGRFDSGDLNLWTGIGALEYGGKTYHGVGSILTVEPIVETTNIEATGLSLTLSGLDNSIIAIAINENYQNRPAYIYMGAFDENWQVITEPYLVFEGRMDVMPIEKSDDTTTVTMQLENIMVDLTKATILNYTPEDQKLFFPNDTGFDRVTSLQSKDIVLGGG